MPQPQTLSPKMQAFLENNAKPNPPSPCSYKPGDRVLFFNAAGIVFGPYTVLGYTTADNIVGGGFIYIDYDCYWFPVAPAHLVPYDEGVSGAGLANYANRMWHAIEFTSKYAMEDLGGVYGAGDEEVLLKARPYDGAPHKELYQMVCEYLNTRPVSIPPCNADLIRRILSIGPGSAT